MFELEYLMLFGSPENKTEILDGRTRLVFPFLDGRDGDTHLRGWAEAIHRWRGGAAPELSRDGERCIVESGGATLTRYPGPIEVCFPFQGSTLRAIDTGFWRRDLWDAQPEGMQTGWDSTLDHSDVRMNLGELFNSITRRYGG